MSSFTIDLPQDEADRLAELAKREGATPEAFARDAVRARLGEEAGWEAEVRAGLAELEVGGGMTLEDFEREMDDFMRGVRVGRG
jgi:predicted transcriptional regulator